MFIICKDLLQGAVEGPTTRWCYIDTSPDLMFIISKDLLQGAVEGKETGKA